MCCSRTAPTLKVGMASLCKLLGQPAWSSVLASTHTLLRFATLAPILRWRPGATFRHAGDAEIIGAVNNGFGGGFYTAGVKTRAFPAWHGSSSRARIWVIGVLVWCVGLVPQELDVCACDLHPYVQLRLRRRRLLPAAPPSTSSRDPGRWKLQLTYVTVESCLRDMASRVGKLPW